MLPVTAEVDPSAVRARERFVATREVADGVRAVVADGWLRDRARRADPSRVRAGGPVESSGLERTRRVHPLSGIVPVLDDLVLDGAAAHSLVAAFTDRRGVLLWVGCAPVLRDRATTLGFVPGADWSEGGVGTTALSLALRHHRLEHLNGPEHLVADLSTWSSVASPVIGGGAHLELGCLVALHPGAALPTAVRTFVAAGAALARSMSRSSLATPTSA